jgi:hypothetical protein
MDLPKVYLLREIKWTIPTYSFEDEIKWPTPKYNFLEEMNFTLIYI